MSRELRLETLRLYMRAPLRNDFKPWRAARELSRGHLQPWEPLWSQEANTRADWNMRFRAWRAARRSDRAYAFLLFSTKDDQLLGGVALTNIRRGAVQSASLGYWLSVDATGQGFMTEAVQRICDWARSDLKLARLEASAMPDNMKSRKILEQCGFHKEGLAKSYLQISGKRRDHVLYGLMLTA